MKRMVVSFLALATLASCSGCNGGPNVETEFCVVYEDQKVCFSYNPKTDTFRIVGDVELTQEKIDDLIRKAREQFKR
jgi:hypothetical protein